MKKKCVSCGGSGQISYFQGVSRFLLTTEECPECSGTGYIQKNSRTEQNKDSRQVPDNHRRKKEKKE